MMNLICFTEMAIEIDQLKYNACVLNEMSKVAFYTSC